MKRVFAVLLATFAIASCNRDHKKVIAVIPKGNSHLFWQSVHAGAVAAARELNVDVAWNGPAGETDYTGQLKIVDSMINRHVDAIALAPIDRQAMVGVVERAVAANIPVIIFDSGIDTDKITAQVATDNYAAGEMAAERMGKILDGKGKVAILAVMPGAASTMAREAGFEELMKKKYPGITIVEKQYGMADVALSLTKAENIITAHPDLNGIFTSNESGALGCAQALRNRKGAIKLVGFDSGPSLIDDLKSGIIDSLVVQDPFKMGQQSVQLAVDQLAGKPITKMNALPAKLVTQENLATPEVNALLNPDLKKYLE